MLHDAIPSVSLHREGDGSLYLGRAGGPGALNLIRGAQGLGAAPVSFSSAPRLAGHGSTLRGKRLDEREIFLPLELRGGTMSGANEVRDDLRRFLSPLDDRELTLRVSVPGRDRWREIPVHYAGGLEGNDGDGYYGHWERVGLEFRSTEALWRGEPVSISHQVDPGTKPFLSATEPFFPVLLADSTVAGRISVDVAGDAPTAPVWTIAPPGEDLVIRHGESGAEFYLDGYLSESITLDMSNGRLSSVSDPNGDLLWERVSVKSRTFNLNPGRNSIEFALVGSTPESMVHVTYQPRYLAGY